MASPKNASENSGDKPKEYAPPTGRMPPFTATRNNKMIASANGGTLDKNSDPMKAPVQPAAFERRHCAKQVANNPTDDDRRKHDRQTPGQRRLDQITHRRRIVRERSAEVALEHIADINQELLPQRLVEAELPRVLLVNLL